jgi:hypothetical protein
VHVLDGPRREAAVAHLRRDERLDVLRCELRERHLSEHKDDVEPHQVLVTTPGHRTDALLGYVIEPAL